MDPAQAAGEVRGGVTSRPQAARPSLPPPSTPTFRTRLERSGRRRGLRRLVPPGRGWPRGGCPQEGPAAGGPGRRRQSRPAAGCRCWRTAALGSIRFPSDLRPLAPVPWAPVSLWGRARLASGPGDHPRLSWAGSGATKSPAPLNQGARAGGGGDGGGRPLLLRAPASLGLHECCVRGTGGRPGDSEVAWGHSRVVRYGRRSALRTAARCSLARPPGRRCGPEALWGSKFRAIKLVTEVQCPCRCAQVSRGPRAAVALGGRPLRAIRAQRKRGKREVVELPTWGPPMAAPSALQPSWRASRQPPPPW